jgi:hypothetical protein
MGERANRMTKAVKIQSFLKFEIFRELRPKFPGEDSEPGKQIKNQTRNTYEHTNPNLNEVGCEKTCSRSPSKVLPPL